MSGAKHIRIPQREIQETNRPKNNSIYGNFNYSTICSADPVFLKAATHQCNSTTNRKQTIQPF